MDASSHRPNSPGLQHSLNTIAEGAASNSTTLASCADFNSTGVPTACNLPPARKPTRSHLSASVRYGVANRTAAPRAAKPLARRIERDVTDRRSKSVHRAKERQARGERRRQKRDGACHLHPMSQPGFSPALGRGVHKPNAALSNSAGIWWIPARKSRLSSTVNSPNRVKDWAR